MFEIIKNHYKIFGLLVCILSAYSCKKTISISQSEIISINIDSIQESKAIKLSNYFIKYEIVPLQTTHQNTIGVISKIEICNDTIYIFDGAYSKKIFVFTSKGKFIRQLGSAGKGPHEYIQPVSFTLDSVKREILVLDNQLKKILIYSFEGDNKKDILLEKRYRSSSITSLNGKIFIDAKMDISNNKENYLVREIDSRGKEVNNFIEIPRNNKGFAIPVVSSFTGRFFKTQNEIIYTNEFSNIIYSISAEGARQSIRLLSKDFITIDELNLIQKNFEGNNPMGLLNLSGSVKTYNISNYLVNSQRAIFNFNKNRKTRTLFLDIKSKKFQYSQNVVDDLTFLEGGFTRFSAVYKNAFVLVVSDRQVEDLKKLVSSGKLKLNPSGNKTPEILNEQSNPVLIFYYDNKPI
jgi:hypothetical protein